LSVSKQVILLYILQVILCVAFIKLTTHIRNKGRCTWWILLQQAS